MSYRVLWITLTCSGAFGSACAIKISTAFGAGDSELAKKRVYIGYKMILGISIIMSCVVLRYTRELGNLFTSEDDFS